MIDFRQLIKAGVHFGHQKTRWCPKMAPYIWGHKNNVHLIDISKTAWQLEKAAKFLEGVAAEGKQILWVGTKKAARDIIVHAATDLKAPYVSHRWVGGTLSNHSQVKKSVTKLLHYEDVVSKAEEFPLYTKKEFNSFKKSIEKLKKSVGGIRSMAWPVGAVVIVDVCKEVSALKEAHVKGIPVVALVDTNCDPSMIDYVIPANDDAPQSIKVLIDYLAEAVARGQQVAATSEEDVATKVVREAAVEQESEKEALLARVLQEDGEESSSRRSKTTVSKGAGESRGSRGSAPRGKKKDS